MGNITVTDEDVIIYNQRYEEQNKVQQLNTIDYFIPTENGNLLLEMMEKIETNNIWVGSKNEKIKTLGIDAVGKVGELMVESLVRRNPKTFNIEYDGDSNTNKEDGIYDMKIYPLSTPTTQSNITIKTEVKTATIGTTGETFQYETFKENVCDKYILISITPNSEFMTFIDPSEIYPVRSHKIFNRKLTIRKQTDVGKLTLSLSSLYKGIQHGNTIELSRSTNEQIKRFLEKHFTINE